MGVTQPGLPFDMLNAILLEQGGNSTGKRCNNLAAPVNGHTKIVSKIVKGNPKLLCTTEKVKDFGILKQRLAGNAPPVEANSSQLIPLHYCGLQPKLASTDGGYVTARPRSDYSYVIVRQLEPHWKNHIIIHPYAAVVGKRVATNAVVTKV